MTGKKIIILLSSKSSGSSAFQTYLEKCYGVQTLSHSRHFEKETLYWTKAASILRLPQLKMHRSVVPYSSSAAKKSLESFLGDNGVSISKQITTKEQLFEHFFEICCNTGLLVFEKSPHHLFNRSNLDLIFEFINYIKGRADVVIFGLIRNPIETVYSAWRRWKFNCRGFENEWYQSYKNLKSLVDDRPDLIVVYRYEEIVRSTLELDRFMNEIGLVKTSSIYNLNPHSVGKWVDDHTFRHRLRSYSKDLAMSFGYSRTELENDKPMTVSWNLSEFKNIARYVFIRTKKSLVKIARK